MDTEAVKCWWNANCKSLVWSGAIQGMYWDDLWDIAKEELTKIYNSSKVE